MKTSLLRALLLAGMLAQAITAGAQTNATNGYFAATVRGTCKQIGGDDKIVTTRFDNNTIIRDYVAAQDPAPDPRDLKLAYDPAGDRIVIINSTGESLSDVFIFDFVTSAADSADARRVRHVFVFPEGGTDAIGSAILTERITRDFEQNITKLSTRGTLQFAKEATEETAAQVCTGTFTTGRKLILQTPEPPEQPEP